MPHSYTLIAGGYEIYKDGVKIAIQTDDPNAPPGTPLVDPEAAAQAEVAYLDSIEGIQDPGPSPIAPTPPTPEELREAAKVARAETVSSSLITTTAGNTFNADEIAQGRMGRAINALNILNARLAAGNPIILPPEAANTHRIVDNQYETIWVLADDSVIFANVAELSEALVLSGVEQTIVWVIE